MLFSDALQLGQTRKTADGFLVTRARAARAGIYDYLGKEVDPEGNTFAADQVVKVYRSEAEVFAQDSVASFLMKPVTNDHPSQPVTAANWRDFAKGVVGKALRDGEYLAFDIVLMDQPTIDAVEAGKRELSNGYASVIDFTPGQTEDGQAFDATQKQIRGNHVAVVEKGRAGPMCRISDAASCEKLPGADLIALLTDERTYSPEPNGNKKTATEQPLQDGDLKMPHTLIIDGLQVTDVSDQAKAAIEKLQGQVKAVTDAKAESDTKVGELTATVSTKDGEIAALNQKLEDAKVSPAQLEKLVADRSVLIGQAKAVHTTIVTDGKTEAEIRKEVVTAKLGDAAKDMDDAAISGAFAVLTKDAVAPGDPVRNALSGGVINAGDDKATYDKAMKDRRATLQDAWKGAPANAA